VNLYLGDAGGPRRAVATLAKPGSERVWWGWMIEFRVLGSVAACRHHQPVALAPQQRLTLAALLINTGRVISVDQLSRWLWNDHPPATAATAIQVHISQLRKRLGLGPERIAPSHLLTQAPGYLLQLGDSHLDLVTFRRTLNTARRHRDAGDLTQAARAYREALAAVRGDPLAGLPPTGPVRRAAERIGSEILAAQEERIEVELGNPSPDLLAELDQLVARHPRRETLRCLLVEALHRNGRRIEALEVLRDGRAWLTRRSARLDELQKALLARPAAPATASACTGTPAAPPPPPLGLVGRSQELNRLYQVLSVGRRTADRPTALIAGPPGAGKSTLALAVAERLAARYPDGRIYVAADSPPNTDPVGLLRRALYALEAAEQTTGLSTCELTNRVRRRIDGHQMLLVVDGVHHNRQLAALASAGWAGMLITTLGAPVLPDADLVTLDVLDEASAVDLLCRAAGLERVLAQPDAARRVVDHCDRLPIAIRAAGAQLARCPHWSVADLADRLADRRRRLDRLQCGDLNVRAAIDRTYRAIPAPLRAAFRRLSQTSPAGQLGDDAGLGQLAAADRRDALQELTVAWAAVALGTTREEAARTLHALARTHLLIRPDAPERPEPSYRLLGLFAEYGRERGQTPADP
jgi:DNA-binding SARP family transcriptional activator